MKYSNKELAKKYPKLADRAKRDNRTPLAQLRYENEQAIQQHENKHPFHNGSETSIDPVTGAKMF